MNARLYKGPFSGKVLKNWHGGNVILMSGPKKMSRRQRYEAEAEYYRSGSYSSTLPFQIPMVEAEYRIVMRPVSFGMSSGLAPCTHPDGSVFYEWTGKKVER